MKKILTLSIIYQHPKVLLGMKKRGFGQGRWNGFGGKVKDGETIEEALKREMEEEVGITPKSFEKVGIIEFEFLGEPEMLEVHFFKVNEFIGEPKESEEMKPKWFNIKEIPFHQMWPDDQYWFPILLKGKKFKGRFVFEGHDKILEYELHEVNLIS
jgi:8-oxo-dGTP diphosphatase/2-hydroxy-dATP diphosphatase